MSKKAFDGSRHVKFAAGLAIGIAFGVAIGNIVIGAGMGAALGFALRNSGERRKKDE